MNTMTKLAAAVALTVSFTASADYVGTSQFDGTRTWINTYVDVNDALGFSEVNRDFSYSCNCGGGTLTEEEQLEAGLITGEFNGSVSGSGSVLDHNYSGTASISGGTGIGGEVGANEGVADASGTISGSHLNFSGSVHYDNVTGIFSVTTSDGTSGSSMGASAIKVLPMATNADAIRGDHKITLEGLVTDFMK